MMKLSETLQEVIALAQAIHNYWEAELPRRHPDYPRVHPGEDDGPSPPEEMNLQELLASLPADVVYKIALIMHVGRGDFGTGNLTKHYQTLTDRYETPQRAASVVRKPLLAEYLSDGLTELRKNGIDVDNLPLTPIKSGG
jgi:hypothetical protein